MSTWHQKQRPTVLFHETKFRVITDPPNELMTCMTFDDEAAAREFVGKAGPYSYLLFPRNYVDKD
jgi:hypothetical protein